MPDEDKGARLDNRIVVLVSTEFKVEYNNMCKAIEENQSDHIRTALETELALYKASKGQA